MILFGTLHTQMQMTAILTERSVSFTSVTLLSVYIASISLTFEVKLNSSTDYTSGVSEFMEYFNDESFQLGEYNVFEGSRGLLGIVPSGKINPGVYICDTQAYKSKVY